MEDIEQLTRQLAEVVDQLNATPADDFATRHQLRVRQDELRSRAAELRVDADETRSTVELQRELAAREAQIVALYGSAMEQISQSGGSGTTAGAPVAAAEGGLVARGREASGGPEIRARIAKLRAVLATRDDA